jgi:hypothetical protein
VFDEKGKEKAATQEIEFGNNTEILYVSGRTIKPDGTVLDLDKDAIFTRDLVRAGGVKIRVKSFAMPGVEPGAIVEYRWKEIRSDPRSLMYIRLQFQRDFPIQNVTYFLKPLSSDYTPYKMRFSPFNCQPSPLKLEKDGFNSTSLENVPAFRKEPFMPSEPNIRPWALAFYTDTERRNPDKYWIEVGKKSYQALKQASKADSDIEAAAAATTSGSKNDEEKVSALLRYMRTHFRNTNDPRVSEAERAKVWKRIHNNGFRPASEVFKTGIGMSHELSLVFAAMASSAGLDARPAQVPDRNEIAFDPRLVDDYFLRNLDMVVRIGPSWKIYDPNARLLAPDMIPWEQEGVKVLLGDPKQPSFITTPQSPPEASMSLRTARMTLSEDGALEGDVEESYTGHIAAGRRSDMEGESEGRIQEQIKKQIMETFPQAETSAIRVEHVEETWEPLAVRYHVRIPGYAQRTGKRLFLRPVYFQCGSTPLFQSSDRKYDVWFRYAWKETELVTIQLPSGFVLDNPDSPGNFGFGKAGSYQLNLGVRNGSTLVCDREFVFGNNGMLFVGLQGYPTVKKIFDEVHRRDEHAISLKQAATAPKAL